MSAATPAPATLSELVRELADRHGDREALVQGERRIDYAGLERASAELALGLVAGGAGKGTRIALLMPNGPDCVIAWLAAARIGALVIPLSTFYPARELHWVLPHADVHTLLCRDRYLNHDYLERLEKLAPSLSGSARPPLYLSELPYLRSVWVWGEGERSWTRPGPGGTGRTGASHPGVDEELLRELEYCVTPADPTVIIYTSGSTAEPKGAVHTHGAILRHTRMVNESLPCGPEDVCFFPGAVLLGRRLPAPAPQPVRRRAHALPGVVRRRRRHRADRARGPHGTDGLAPPGQGDPRASALRRPGPVAPAQRSAGFPAGRAPSVRPRPGSEHHRHDRDIRPPHHRSRRHGTATGKARRLRPGAARLGAAHRRSPERTPRRSGRAGRALGARLQPDAGAVQARARAGLHARRLLPHGRPRSDRRRRLLLLPRPPGRHDQDRRRQRLAARGRRRAALARRDRTGLRGRGRGSRDGADRGSGRGPLRRLSA